MLDTTPEPRAVVKYPRTHYWPSSPSFPADGLKVADVNRFIGVPVVVTEKLDGSNTLLHRGRVYGRSTAEPSDAKWYGMVKKWHAWKTSLEDGYFYGEDIYGVHSIKYDPVPEDETYYIFALRHGAMFAEWDAVEAKAADLNIPTVPILHKGTFASEQKIDAFMASAHQRPSALGGDCEGVVLRVAAAFPAERFATHVCKSVRPNHMQPGAGHWRTHWQPCPITSPRYAQSSEALAGLCYPSDQ